MADTKISALTTITGAATAVGDLFPIVDISIPETKSITRAELALALNVATGGGTATGTNTGDQTNITGNAATVTTNANLTGHITSVGNTASLGSFTLAQLSTAVSDADVASVAYVDSSVIGLLDDRGSYDASVNVFPSTGGSGTAGAILKGDCWYVSVAGTLGVAVNIGDNFRALVDTPGQTTTNWSILEGNLGYVPANVANGLSQFASSSTSSAQLAALLTDETGSGAAVFATSPTLTTPIIDVINPSSVGTQINAGSSGTGISDATLRLVKSVNGGFAAQVVSNASDGTGAFNYMQFKCGTSGVPAATFYQLGGEWTQGSTRYKPAGFYVEVDYGSAATEVALSSVGHADSSVAIYAGTNPLTPTSTFTSTGLSSRIKTRVGSTTSSATPTINTDTVDIYKLTAQAADITSFTTNLSGTPIDGDVLMIQITGTAARAITWGSSFEASTVALPTTTVTTARLDVSFIWNTATSKWRCIGAA